MARYKSKLKRYAGCEKEIHYAYCLDCEKELHRDYRVKAVVPFAQKHVQESGCHVIVGVIYDPVKKIQTTMTVKKGFILFNYMTLELERLLNFRHEAYECRGISNDVSEAVKKEVMKARECFKRADMTCRILEEHDAGTKEAARGLILVMGHYMEEVEKLLQKRF